MHDQAQGRTWLQVIRDFLAVIGFIFDVRGSCLERVEAEFDLSDMPQSWPMRACRSSKERQACDDVNFALQMLSRKLVTVKEVTEQQLSKQHHYDYGLRSLFLPVIRAAGN